MKKNLALKVCGMADPTSLQEVASLSPDFMGFIFYPKSPRYLQADAETLTFINSLSPSIKKVGVFVNEQLATIIELAQKYRLSYIQLHGDESPSFAQALQEQGLKVIKVFRVQSTLPSNLNDYLDCAEYFLFDTDTKHYGGSGEHFDWRLLAEYSLNKPFILSGGLTLADIEHVQALTYPQLIGIDVNSRFEIEAGKKDFAKLQQLTQKLR